MPNNKRDYNTNEQENYEYEEELSFFDILNVIWRRKFSILIITSLFAAFSIFRALTATITYQATCTVLPLQSKNSLDSITSSLGGLASFIGLPRTASSGQMLLAILASNSVIDGIIDNFNLMEDLSMDIREKARESVKASLEATENVRSGIITISYIHKDPQTAADIANAFVVELNNKMQSIAAEDAQQKRNFFESQLVQAQKELNEAEDAMINYQQRSGVVVLDSQTTALITAINDLRKQIATKNVEVSSLKSYARRDNPRLKLAQSQLDAMKRELQRLEEQQKISDTNARDNLTSGDTLSSLGRVPELGREYTHYARALQFATAKYEAMLRQYESARLSEANDMTSISVLDYATPPYDRYSPRRTRMVLIGAGGGFALSLIWAFIAEYLRKMKEERDNQELDNDDDDD